MKFLLTTLILTLAIPLGAMRSGDMPEPSVSAARDIPAREDRNIPWALISAGSGVLGLILAFTPYLSVLGVLLGAAAVVFSILAFRKKRRKRWAWLGMITGGLTVLAFLGVVGLIAFF